MKTISIFQFFLFLVLQLSAQNIYDAQSSALGSTGIHLQKVNSSFHNPAGLAQLPRLGLGLNAQSKYLIEGFNTLNAAVAYPLASGTFGFNTYFEGVEGYSRIKIGLSYARRISEKFSIGAEINMYSLSILSYGSAIRPSVKIGVQYFLNPQLLISSVIDNPTGSNWNEEANSRIPTILLFGLAYLPSDKLAISVEAENDLEFPLFVKAGIEYSIVDQLDIRIGGSSLPTSFTAGFGLNLNQLHIDMSAAYDTNLGISPTIGIRYE